VTPRVSIVIPLHILNERFRADLALFKSLAYDDYEIVIVSDASATFDVPGVTQILTGRTQTGPAEKRDLALAHCRGEICAFIDDDAYPHPFWLKNAVPHFERSDVAAVCGPGLTPPEDLLLARAGGAVYEARLGSGSNVYRFRRAPRREVDDYPAYNLLVRKSVLEEIGGFASTFYGGEDTKVCLAIVQTGRKILYDPDVIVYHHRRPLLVGHVRQIFNVGLHRGFFVKRFPATSRRLVYFLPLSGLVLATTGAMTAAVVPGLRPLFATGVAGWTLAALISAWMVNPNPFVAVLASVGITATHVAYAIGFARGLMLRDLER
jgi:cellulose synthase/poly-beta-1,6-N-acetylglucosamine synthase-like glycosyltransferase